jgi:hypothetical protein
LQLSADGLDKIIVAPRTEVVTRVMNYARKTAVQESESVPHT